MFRIVFQDYLFDRLPGQLLGSAIDVYLNNNDLKSAVKTLNRFNETEDIVGNPRFGFQDD